MNWENRLQDFDNLQQPKYFDKVAYESVLNEIQCLPVIKSTESIKSLRNKITFVSQKKGFILQMGDCTELFVEMNKENSLKKMCFYSLSGKYLESLIKKDVCIIGRIAGQFAKPRSSELEKFQNAFIKCYKGDLINDLDERKRDADPNRLITGYQKSTEVNEHITYFQNSGKDEYLTNFIRFKEEIILDIPSNDIRFAISKINEPQSQIYTSQECLHLDYESCFIRISDEKQYMQTADSVWIGNRTRNLKGGHIELCRKVENLIGMKIDSSLSGEEFVELIKRLNPMNEENKLIIITRFGNGKINGKLEEFISLKQNLGLNILWMIDPMHGNTFTLESGLKTRDFDSILSEITTISGILKEKGEVLSGLHLESTFDNVTEVLGGSFEPVSKENVHERYKTGCDPRLNALQTLELISKVADSFV